MPNEQLLQYIRQNYSNFTRQDITQSLMSAGWAIPDIAAAYQAVESERTPAPSPAAAPAQAQSPDTTFLTEMERRRRQTNEQPLPNAGATEARPQYTPPQSTTTEKGIIGLLIKSGLVKNTQQANIVMIGIVVVAMGASAWLLL